MAAQYALRGHPATTDKSMLVQGDLSVFRTGRLKAASAASHAGAGMQHRRKHELVKQVHDASKRYVGMAALVHARVSRFALSADASTVAKMRATSPASLENSISRTLLRGCSTMSTSAFSWSR